MAIKEDILEQIVEEFLIHKGYFVQHNLKYKPAEDHPNYNREEDCVCSDIDVIGYNPHHSDHERVVVVSCKSWQGGFGPEAWIRKMTKGEKMNGRPAWKAFRELTKPKWSAAFVAAIKAATGTDRFTHVTAVTRLKGDRKIWESHRPFEEAIQGNPIRIWDLREMTETIHSRLTTTLAGTDIGRILQLFKAAGMAISPQD